MKVFISADIEGTTLTSRWDETHPVKELSKARPFVRQMTEEVKAACEGAIAAGATEILVKDAHGPGVNLELGALPECVQVVRNWCGHPHAMVYGVDESFDAAMFIGYHSAAGQMGNPLSHTYSTATTAVRLNGQVCSEFMLYSWCCASMGVPSVLLTGDRMLIDDSEGLHPALKTVAVKDGLGGSIKCIHPALACKKIRESAQAALEQDLSRALCRVPEHFVLELSYKEHKTAVRRSWFPGFSLVDSHTIRMETDELMDVLRCVPFIF